MAWVDDDQRLLFVEHVRNVEKVLCQAIKSETYRFPSREKLLARFHEAENRLLREGLDGLNQFLEVQNELCVAAEILKDSTEGGCCKLEYEPAIDECSSLFDYCVEYPSGPKRWIEVKTIHPRMQNDWNRYLRDFKNDRFTRNTRLVLERDWMGGQLYHHAFAARSKILEYALETEQKIETCLKSEERRITFLVLFSNGFDWHIDHLEDFLAYYRHGSHFVGDHFAKMEQYYIETKGVTMKRNIHHFAYIKRPDLSVVPIQVVWSVLPARWPST
jgi:hypothetical protein